MTENMTIEDNERHAKLVDGSREQRFEHVVTVCDKHQLEACFNLYQESGWELVTVMIDFVRTSNRELYWKRPYISKMPKLDGSSSIFDAYLQNEE